MQNNNVKDLPVIPDGTIPNILLLGNGINRAYGDDSLAEMIEDMARRYDTAYNKDIYGRMPFNMRVVAASQDHVNDETKAMGDTMMNAVPSGEQQEYVRKLLSLPMNSILTVNYSYELEKSVIPDISPAGIRSMYRYAKKPNKKSDRMVHQYVDLVTDRFNRNIWHIHGVASAPSSMIIGHYYYGKLLTRIQNHVPSLMRRLAMSRNRGEGFLPQSWIDYFLLGNVYVFGFGYDLAETDLWWLACCKKRHFPDTKLIFFEPKEDLDK